MEYYERNDYSNFAYQPQQPAAQPQQDAAYSQTAPQPQQPAAQPPQHAARVAPEKKPGLLKTFLVAFVGAALACALVMGLGGLLNPKGKSTVLGSTLTGVSATDVDATLPEAVAAKCLPSVVSIDVYSKQSNSYSSLYEYYFGGGAPKSNELALSSLGSGVVLSEDGYIITNNHVVEGSDALKVNVQGEEFEAELVGVDASSDIAVIKVKNAGATKFVPMEIGDSDKLTIGEWVMTIGSPFGLEQSVATGIVSATNRSQVYSAEESGSQSGSPTVYTNLIQTDAAINPGNSGGALVDADGHLIGINTLITSYSGNYSGVGFAIPINYAMGLAQDIIAGKTPSHAQLGVSTTTVNSAIAKRYDLSVTEGAYVAVVNAGSAAEQAGIAVGDIIVSIDGTKVTSSSDVMLAVRSKNTGDTISITVNRSGQTVNMQATLGSDAPETQPAQNSLFGRGGSPLG